MPFTHSKPEKKIYHHLQKLWNYNKFKLPGTIHMLKTIRRSEIERLTFLHSTCYKHKWECVKVKATSVNVLPSEFDLHLLKKKPAADQRTVSLTSKLYILYT
jgi:hypothetical protein